jgi:hypothetical protein
VGRAAYRIELSRKYSREVLREVMPIFEFDTSYREIQASKLDASILPYDPTVIRSRPLRRPGPK